MDELPGGRVRSLSLKRSPGWLPRYGKCMSSSHALKFNKKDLNEKDIGNISKISYLLESLASSLASACQNHRRGRDGFLKQRTEWQATRKKRAEWQATRPNWSEWLATRRRGGRGARRQLLCELNLLESIP